MDNKSTQLDAHEYILRHEELVEYAKFVLTIFVSGLLVLYSEENDSALLELLCDVLEPL